MAKKRNAKKKVVTKNAPATNKVQISNDINSEAIAAALSTTNLPVLLKLCRLCETKDGPFLNIFDSDKVIAKKIEDVMPFVVAENDDLPHKICFRCSAKVEELHEFIQKCVKTQISLRRAVGSKTPLPPKVKHRALWEEKLNESNISNDDLCDALIKKAMESIKEPLKAGLVAPAVAPNEETKMVTKKESDNSILKEVLNKERKEILWDYKTRSSPSLKHEKRESEVESSKDDSDIPLKRLKLQLKSENSKSTLNEETKKTGKSASIEGDVPKVEESPLTVEKSGPKVEKKSKTSKSGPNEDQNASNPILPTNTPEGKSNKPECKSVKTNTFSLDTTTKPEDPKPFNILDHISMIKVNSVGVLYQCKLCNRNFLKKEVILTHGCAKSGGVKKSDIAKDLPKPEIPKMPTVKYINTKVNNESKKPLPISEPINLVDDEEDNKPLKPPPPTKPRIGPASKVKKNFEPDPPPANPVEPTVPQAPVVQFPQAPSINGRYKLVPGPNNTFTLVEEGSLNSSNAAQDPINPIQPSVSEIAKETKPTIKTKASKKVNLESLEPPPQSASHPYPVGLFQRVPHNSNSTPIESPTFTTPAMKKQSYTIVQTGNPNKLLISTKSQPEVAPNVPTKKSRKSKHEPRSQELSKEPFLVTLEDSAPPQDPGFFSFINVDPLLQPSYVLPTDGMIQESQISTTNIAPKNTAHVIDKDLHKYTCNMCNLKFDREKKLLTHIQSHYNQMDQEDELRNAKKTKRTKK